jgi:nitrate reductase beta subunit
VSETGLDDVNFQGLDAARFLSFAEVFLFYLPRLCEHCLNPACVASCPSGALYKRAEDGIVLVDQHRCRGWRYCVSGCPYKKIYFNWNTGRSEKCILCYPRTEAALPTLCAQTCVGRIRYLGLVLYDADCIGQAASVKDPTDLYPAQLEILLDPEDPAVRREARSQGISDAVLDAARRSPVDALIRQWKLALPLHPEFRTLPMVWYVPPLSPVKKTVDADGPSLEKRIDTMRIPTAYLANLLAAGDERPVRRALQTLLALRRHMRSVRLGEDGDSQSLNEVGIRPETADAMYRLLALARFRDRFVVPTRPGGETFGAAGQGTCGFEGSVA